MEYRSTEELRRIADLHDADVAAPPMSRAERLDRWVALLRAEPARRLNTLHGTEYQPAEIRDRMREDHSPISIAFADPVLRVQGLRDDTYGEAKRFFGLGDRDMHHILCYCHFGSSMSADAAAERIAAAARPRGGFFSQAWRALTG